MSIYVCGDTHFPHDAWKLTNRHWPEQKELTKDDYLIIAGDFGMLWLNEPDKEEKYLMKELANRKFTTLFVDGNHENFTRLNVLEEIDMFGGKVGKVCDSIYHLKRGYVYNINGKRLFCFGGAMSTDKEHRLVDISWWREETQSRAEEMFALDNLDKVGWQVDHVITHAAPKSIVGILGYDNRFNDPVAKFLEFILTNGLKFKSWHFGHYHNDRLIHDKFYCHYNTEPWLMA